MQSKEKLCIYFESKCSVFCLWCRLCQVEELLIRSTLTVCVCVCVCATTFDARTPAPIARREVRETLVSVLSAEGVDWGRWNGCDQVNKGLSQT